MNVIMKVFGVMFLLMGIMGFTGIMNGEKDFSEWFFISAFIFVLGLLGIFYKKKEAK